MKKKRICGLALLVTLLLSVTQRAHADGVVEEADYAWEVSFTEDRKMSSTYDASGVESTVSGMQPGDTAVFCVTLENRNGEETDWYMKNTIVRSMEENSPAEGGAYSYRLSYVNEDGETILYDSGAVGGEDSAGLHDMDQALEDYFYLDGLSSGEGGRVVLKVGLDGETQGNSYQTRIANLSMNFAVETKERASGGGGGRDRVIRREVVNGQVIYVDEDGKPVDPAEAASRITPSGIVRTGDTARLFPQILAACVSGILLMVYALFGRDGQKRGEKREGDGEE